MIYRVFTGFDTSGKPVYHTWRCDCEICQTTTGECQDVMAANFNEDKKKLPDTALYASLRK